MTIQSFRKAAGFALIFVLWADLLSLEEFRLLSNDAFQRFLLQRGVKRSQLVRNSRHTWLYQGKGAHHVLQNIKKRWVLKIHCVDLFFCCCLLSRICFCHIWSYISMTMISIFIRLSNRCLIYFSVPPKSDSPHRAPTHFSRPQWAAPGGTLWGRRALPRPPRQRPCLSWNCLHTHAACGQYLHSFWNIL